MFDYILSVPIDISNVEGSSDHGALHCLTKRGVSQKYNTLHVYEDNFILSKSLCLTCSGEISFQQLMYLLKDKTFSRSIDLDQRYTSQNDMFVFSRYFEYEQETSVCVDRVQSPEGKWLRHWTPYYGGAGLAREVDVLLLL